MKNYKFLVPIVLVVMFFASIYMLYDTKANELEEYNNYLKAARDFREMDIQVDAEANYLEALNMQKSLELSVEIGEFYRETEQIQKALEWGERLTSDYPTNPAGYEYLMGIHDQRQDYRECFRLAETFEKRELKSTVVDEILNRIAYTFYFNGGYEDAGVYSGGHSPVMRKGKWAYVTQTGSKITDHKFIYAGPFASGLAPVTEEGGACYFIDTEGNKKHVILGVENIERLGFIEDGIFPLYDGKSWSFYDMNHQVVFGGFEDASALGNGIVAVKKNDKWQLLDSTGAAVGTKTYDSVIMDDKQVVYRNERLFVSNGDKIEMITSTGEVVGSGKYEEARLFNDATYAAVKINGKWGYIDKEGKIVVEPVYDDARSFSNGLAAVMKDGAWGFIDTEGKTAIVPQFEDARDFNSSGCVYVLTDGQWMLLRLYKTNH